MGSFLYQTGCVVWHTGKTPVCGFKTSSSHGARGAGTHGGRFERTHGVEAGGGWGRGGGGGRGGMSPSVLLTELAVIGLSRAPEVHRKETL